MDSLCHKEFFIGGQKSEPKCAPTTAPVCSKLHTEVRTWHHEEILQYDISAKSLPPNGHTTSHHLPLQSHFSRPISRSSCIPSISTWSNSVFLSSASLPSSHVIHLSGFRFDSFPVIDLRRNASLAVNFLRESVHETERERERKKEGERKKEVRKEGREKKTNTAFLENLPKVRVKNFCIRKNIT